MSQEPKKIDRRKFIYAGLGAVAVVAIGLAAYFATRPPAVVEKTVVQTQTIEKPVERTIVTTVAGTPTTITQTIERTITPTTAPETPLPIDARKYKKAPSKITLDFYTDKGPFGNNWAKIAQLGNPSFSEWTNIVINPVNFSTTDVFQAAFYQVANTPNAPDLFNWWTGFQLRTITKRGLTLDLSTVWEAHKDEYPTGLKDPYSVDGVPMAVPFSVNYWVVWYRPQVFRQFGINIPKTWDEFIATARALKEAKVKWPILNLWVEWTGFIWLQEVIVRQDPDFYERLMIGKERYTDPLVRNGLKIIADMVKEGLFGNVAEAAAPGHSFYPPPPPLPSWWKENQIGMAAVGDWMSSVFKASGFKAIEDYDFFILPNINPRLGDLIIIEPAPVCVGKNSDAKEYALEYLDFFLSTEAQAWWQTVAWPQVFTNLKIPPELAEPDKKKLGNLLKEKNFRFITRIWEATPPEIIIPISNLMDKLAFNPNMLDEIINEMDAIATKYWSEHPEA
ncbi:hypothetical protein HRbin06_00878 [archaeon HR06]|nr:hypothetical protein HRbin06_00878 [archaeon HR06]